MSPIPEIALIVALIALFGVLVNALVIAYNSRKRGDLDERLVNLKAELDQLNAREIVRAQAENSESLKKLEFEQAKTLADFERKRKTDSERFAAILELLDPQTVIAFFREHDFGGMFDRAQTAPLHQFVGESNGPEQRFLLEDLEEKRVQVMRRGSHFVQTYRPKDPPWKERYLQFCVTA